MENKGTQAVRKAWYAGTWYAADPSVLRKNISQALLEAREIEDDNLHSFGSARFAVLPHAGLAYSARGIAHMLLHAPGNLHRVVILAPSHYAHVGTDRFTTAHFASFDTPIGPLEGFALFDDTYPRKDEVLAALQREHAVEMVLPFLAYLQEERKRNIAVSMALISQVTTAQSARQLAEDLFDAIGQEDLDNGATMVIASSDFTHYGERFGYAPYGIAQVKVVSEKVRASDLELAAHLADLELGPIFLQQRQQRSTVCGIAATLVLSALAAHVSTKGVVADYYTSQEVLGDRAADFVAYCTILWR
jgi:AmmeMemoRadiSam system protein B